MQDVPPQSGVGMILRDARPGARMPLVQSLCDAARALPPGRIEMAFVQLDPDRIAGSRLGRRVVADGGKLVVVSADPADRLPDGWTALPFPFAGEDVVSLLADPA